jgi:hypothetical protein
MSIRYAVAGGIALVITAVGAFLLIPQHLISGTNKISRAAPAIALGPAKTYCQRVAGVPGGAGFVRLGVVRATPAEGVAAHRDYSSFGRVPGVRVSLAGASGLITSGSERDFDSGRVDVPLSEPARAARHARICVVNTGAQLVSLAGEWKLLRRGPRAQGDEKVYAPRLSVTFLDADRSTWASRLDTIETRFRYSHSGAIGTWALWLACLLMLAAAALAIRLIATRAGRG